MQLILGCNPDVEHGVADVVVVVGDDDDDDDDDDGDGVGDDGAGGAACVDQTAPPTGTCVAPSSSLLPVIMIGGTSGSGKSTVADAILNLLKHEPLFASCNSSIRSSSPSLSSSIHLPYSPSSSSSSSSSSSAYPSSPFLLPSVLIPAIPPLDSLHLHPMDDISSQQQQQQQQSICSDDRMRGRGTRLPASPSASDLASDPGALNGSSRESGGSVVLDVSAVSAVDEPEPFLVSPCSAWGVLSTDTMRDLLRPHFPPSHIIWKSTYNVNDDILFDGSEERRRTIIQGFTTQSLYIHTSLLCLLMKNHIIHWNGAPKTMEDGSLRRSDRREGHASSARESPTRTSSTSSKSCKTSSKSDKTSSTSSCTSSGFFRLLQEMVKELNDPLIQTPPEWQDLAEPSSPRPRGTSSTSTSTSRPSHGSPSSNLMTDTSTDSHPPTTHIHRPPSPTTTNDTTTTTTATTAADGNGCTALVIEGVHITPHFIHRLNATFATSSHNIIFFPVFLHVSDAEEHRHRFEKRGPKKDHSSTSSSSLAQHSSSSSCSGGSSAQHSCSANSSAQNSSSSSSPSHSTSSSSGTSLASSTSTSSSSTSTKYKHYFSNIRCISDYVIEQARGAGFLVIDNQDLSYTTSSILTALIERLSHEYIGANECRGALAS